MATYYKYAERNVDSQINWAEVGRGISDMLSNEVKIREEKKAAIDDASRQFAEVLANAPQGEYQPMNDWILKFGDDAAQMRLMQDTLLKSGQLKLRDYTAMRQNITDGVNGMFTIAETIQQDAERKMQRYKDGESQDLEAWLMEQVEGLANFQKSQGYINPATGQVSLGKMVEGPDGVMVLSTDPADLMSIQEMKNYISTEFDYYDSDAVLRENVAEIGKFVTTNKEKLKGFLRTGSMTEISDVKLRDDFESVLNLQIEAMMDNPYNLTSILKNDMKSVITTNEVGVVIPTGETWEFEWYKEGKKYDKNIIVMKDDGSGMPKPMLTEFQEVQIREYLKSRQIGMISEEMKTQTFQGGSPVYAPQYALDRGDEKVSQKAAVGYWNQLYWGNAQQKNEAAEALLSTPMARKSGVTNIDLTESGAVNLIYSDGRTRRIEMGTDYATFAAAGAVDFHGMSDKDAAVKAGGKVASTQANLETGNLVGFDRQQTNKINPKTFENAMKNEYAGVSKRALTEAGPDTLVKSISERLGGFGFRARRNEKSEVIATGPSGTEYLIPRGETAQAVIYGMIDKESVSTDAYPSLILGYNAAP
jgi:hypothetical protein